ncbi:MAG: class F sortase [Actinomycetota bacterium]
MTQALGRFRTPAIIVACIGAVGAALLFGGFTGPPEEKLSVTPVDTPKPKAVSPFTPQAVSIPKIDMEAPTVPVGTTADGAMGTPSNATDIAWWAGRKAGQGNVLLAAHRDWSGRLGSFYRLKELEVGDEIIVNGDKPGKVLTFYVTWKKTMKRDIDATEVLGSQGEEETYGKDGKPVATLITCDGVFDRSLGTARERIVVRAELEPSSGGADEDLSPDVSETIDA